MPPLRGSVNVMRVVSIDIWRLRRWIVVRTSFEDDHFANSRFADIRADLWFMMIFATPDSRVLKSCPRRGPMSIEDNLCVRPEPRRGGMFLQRSSMSMRKIRAIIIRRKILFMCGILITIHAAPPGLGECDAWGFYRHLAPPALDRGSDIFRG
jgi:hypothetical protein